MGEIIVRGVNHKIRFGGVPPGPDLIRSTGPHRVQTGRLRDPVEMERRRSLSQPPGFHQHAGPVGESADCRLDPGAYNKFNVGMKRIRFLPARLDRHQTECPVK